MRGSCKVHHYTTPCAAAAMLVAVAVAACTGWTEAAPAAAVSCDDAISSLIPCGSYLVGRGGALPSPRCCESARALEKWAAATALRRQLCECLKQTGPSFGVKPDRAKQLPSLCKLKLRIPITPTIDCNSIP